MFDRVKVETILSRRFPGASRLEIAAAANALMGLGDEWEEIAGTVDSPAPHVCEDGCCLADYLNHAPDWRVFRRREA